MRHIGNPRGEFTKPGKQVPRKLSANWFENNRGVEGVWTVAEGWL